jgi:general L-amino acid transport system permease protein
MAQIAHDPELFYVASPQAPASRRPPASQIGAVGWMRENLFSSPGNTALTIITALVIGWALVNTISWALRDAEWTVITANLRLLMVGQYEPTQLWRVNLVALVTLFLCGASVVLAAGAGRGVLIALAAAVFALLIIPFSAAGIPPPPIRVLVTPTNAANPLLFIGDAGQVVTIAVEALDDNAQVGDVQNYVGFLENTAGLENSRTLWNDLRAQVTAGTLDLSQYALTLEINVINASGDVLATVNSTPDAHDAMATVMLPASGWYAVMIDRADGATAGNAFVRLDGVTTFTTDAASTSARLARYGEPPLLACPDPATDCLRFVAERDLRFEGSRSLGAYLTTQLVPFVQAVVLPVIAGIAVIVAGGALGAWARRSPQVQSPVQRGLLIAWVVMLFASWFVLRGVEGSTLLTPVPTSVWGGLLLTLILTVVAILASFPLGVLLALGRTSSLPILSAVCTAFIEVIRGVPFITILFFAKLIVPFFISASADVDQVIRMMIGLSIFTAAYLAEVVRGGLQIVPKGQIEASKALGLNGFQQTTQIVLPQALRAVIPAIMNQFVALFKDTSLVAVVGLFELLGIIDFIVNGQQQFRGLAREAYLFVGSIYFVISYAMSAASQWVERTGVGSARR